MAINTDIVIVGEDGTSTYKVPTSIWMQPENKIATDVVGDAAVVVKRGALLAEVPKPDVPVGYYCILINFSEVEDPPVAPDQSADATGSDDIGTNGLIIHAELAGEDSGAYYVISEDAWQQMSVDASKVPISSGLASNGALLAATEEGFLVNLDLIGMKPDPAGG